MRRRPLSGDAVIRILVREFGFYRVSQRGSHMKLRKAVGGGTITTVVPRHRELARRTLRSALKLARVTEDELYSKI